VTAAGTESEGNLANDALADEAPSFSKDGRYVVFSSTDTHMIAGVTSNHVSQVYVRDTCIGAPAGCVPFTTIVSDQSGGQSSNRAFIGFRSISEHGRYVAYLREAYAGTTAQYTYTVMVRDTCIGALAGCVPSTSTASADPDNISKVSSLVYFYPSISADGHYVAFMSGNIASGGGQVYLALTGY
jgi:Tol biopolymer transport system component